jgi:hypothetical protein
MMIAERASARIAVGALALAALAVSAKPAPVVTEPVLVTTSYASLGAIAVVGTPNYERVVEALAPLEAHLDRCATVTTRVSIYAHVTFHNITELTVLGDDATAANCVRLVVLLRGLPVDDDVDLMIPVELVR